MGKLVLVPTPVGNLEDITQRALRHFREAQIIYAEDTRTTGKLMQCYEIKASLVPFHAHNEHRQLERCLATIEQNELTLLVSDAGTPGISDPGFLLVRACIEAGIVVSCLPGPTAFVPALVGSGFPCDRFVFEGFLPHKKGRQTKWKELAPETRTVVLYESPHRLVKALEEITLFVSPDREVCVVREISKMYETYQRGTAAEVLAHYQQNPPKGEIVLVMKGFTE